MRKLLNCALLILSLNPNLSLAGDIGDLRNSCGLGTPPDLTHLADVKQTWEPVSLADPRRHDPAHFQYLISALGFGGNTGAMKGKIASEISGLAARKNISASFINQDYIHTFAGYDYGVILSVPPENLLATLASDMGPKPAKEVADQYGLQTPEALLGASICMERGLAASHPDAIWNEVRFDGESSLPESPTLAAKVIGIFYLSTISKSSIHDLRTIGASVGLPVIGLR